MKKEVIYKTAKALRIGGKDNFMECGDIKVNSFMETY